MRTLLRALKHRVRRLALNRQERRHALVGPAALWKLKRDFQIDFLRKAGLLPRHHLVDIGCGTLRGGIPLIRYLEPGHYCGIEVRKVALDEGRKELEEAGLAARQPLLVHATDVAQLHLGRKFDYAWAFSVLIHMSDDVLERTLGFVSRHLHAEGVFYANVNIGEREEAAWQGFPVVWRSMDWYKRCCARWGLVATDIGSLKDHGHRSNVASQDEQRMLKISRRAA